MMIINCYSISWKTLGLSLSLIFFLSTITFAQQNNFEAGKVTKEVVSPFDNNQRYAVFLPSAYNEDEEWPVVFVMDPRGRALMALELFRETANELGYILISSYNTMSDGPEQPNIDAVNAMINDVPGFFAVNPQRYYLAGFSGTAILSWPYGYQLKDNVAGVIGFSGGPRGFFLPVRIKTEGVAFSFFGGAAYHDFNYFEMLELDEELNKYNYPHAEVFYEGIHSWPQPDIVSDAMYWMELRAMKEKLVPVNVSTFEKYKSDQLAKAQKLEEGGDLYEAYRRYKIARDICKGFIDTELLAKNVNRLKRKRVVKRAPNILQKESKKARKRLVEAAGYFREVRAQKKAPSPEEIMDKLLLNELLNDVENTKDKYLQRAYRVILENIYVKVSFYEPRYFLRSDKPEFSLSMLRVANHIKPEAIRNCYFLARTYAQLDQVDEAIKSLRCMQKAGILSVKMLENDPDLKRISTHPQMVELKKELMSSTED